MLRQCLPGLRVARRMAWLCARALPVNHRSRYRAEITADMAASRTANRSRTRSGPPSVYGGYDKLSASLPGEPRPGDGSHGVIKNAENSGGGARDRRSAPDRLARCCLRDHGGDRRSRNLLVGAPRSLPYTAPHQLNPRDARRLSGLRSGCPTAPRSPFARRLRAWQQHRPRQALAERPAVLRSPQRGHACNVGPGE